MNFLKKYLITFLIIPLFFFIAVTAAGCGDDSTTTKVTSDSIAAPAGPLISSVAPAEGIEGSQVIITGKNFSSTAANNIVKFGDTKAEVKSADATSLTVTVPKLTIGSKYTVSVTIDSESNSAISTFKFLSSTAVTVSNISPVYGLAGTAVTITGTNFNSTLANNIVTFNGSAGYTGTITAATSTSLTVTVPSGASSGSISVTNENGTSISPKNFTVSEYNIREWNFDSLTESPAVENYVFNGGLLEVSGKSLVGANARPYFNIKDIKTNAASPSMKSTNRIQLIKSGSKTVNSLGVPVEGGTCTVYVAALSAGSGTPLRNLIAVDANGTQLTSQALPVSGTTNATTCTFTYSGTAGYIYLYTDATAGNISIFYIGVEYPQ
jgi:hypothetical protein